MPEELEPGEDEDHEGNDEQNADNGPDVYAAHSRSPLIGRVLTDVARHVAGNYTYIDRGSMTDSG
jgi:hypothetical protein